MVRLATDLDPALDAALDAMSTATGQAKSALVTQALRSFVAAEGRFVAAVQVGIDQADAGQLVDHETAMAQVRAARDRRG